VCIDVSRKICWFVSFNALQGITSFLLEFRVLCTWHATYTCIKRWEPFNNLNLNTLPYSLTLRPGGIYSSTQVVSWPSRIPNKPVTSLRHQEGRRVFREGPKFFKLCPILLKCVQHTFPGGRKIFCRGLSPHGYGPDPHPAWTDVAGQTPL